MRCSDSEALLAVRHELSWTQEREVQAHLAGCPACTALARRIERAQQILGALPTPAAPAPDPNAILTRIVADQTHRPRWRPALQFGAVALVVVTIGVVLAILLPLLRPAHTILPDGAATPASQLEGGLLGKLAFVRNGNIWVKTLPDGPEQQLTTDGGNRKPSWSPSGEWLLYQKEDSGNYWLIHRSGKGARLMNEPEEQSDFKHWEVVDLLKFVAWSPVADRLAFSDNLGRLHVLDVGTWDERILTDEPSVRNIDLQTHDIQWSPDGTVIAYRVRWTRSYPYPDPNITGINESVLGTVRLDTGQRQEFGNGSLIGWAGGGTEMLVSQYRRTGGIFQAQLLAYPSAGGGPRTVAENFPLTFRSSVSPDGSKLALIVSTNSSRPSYADSYVATFDPQSGAEQRLAIEPPTSRSIDPAWSRDSAKLAFVVLPGASLAPLNIWIMDGAQTRQLTNDPAYADEWPQWLADSEHILFTRRDTQGRISIWMIDRDGANASLLLEGFAPIIVGEQILGFFSWEQILALWLPPTHPVETFGGVPTESRAPGAPTPITKPHLPMIIVPSLGGYPSPLDGNSVPATAPPPSGGYPSPLTPTITPLPPGGYPSPRDGNTP